MVKVIMQECKKCRAKGDSFHYTKSPPCYRTNTPGLLDAKRRGMFILYTKRICDETEPFFMAFCHDDV